ncbi:prohibitin family protein [Candidatus Woesearchaeota archaeon]|nr:prohibitin family protein [Candidatus Woesearchaeota archaeon]
MPSDKKLPDEKNPFAKKSLKDTEYVLKIIKNIIIGFIILILIWNSFFVVPAGYKGVIFNVFAGTKDKTYDEGLHFKLPFFEKAFRFEVRTRVFNDEASAASKDLQIVSTRVALNYHINKDKVNDLFKNIGPEYEVRIIDPSIQEVVKATTAKHIAEELITKRQLVKDEIKANLKDRLAGYYITLDDLSITNFDFSAEFNKAIEAKVTAEQNALKEQNNLKVVEFQAQQKITQAKGEAEAIRIVNEELSKSPRYIDYLTIQRWDGKMPLALGSGSLLSITGQQK